MADPIYSATQPDSATVLDNAAAPKPKPEALRALGMKMQTRFTQYEQDRKLAELKWIRNSRQYQGVYDPDIDKMIPKDRSRAYPKLTRVKCVSMLSRLMNLLFQAGDKNWTVAPSPVPNLSEEDLNAVLSAMQLQPGQQIDNAKVEQAVMAFAKERAGNLEKEIEDQLQELGGGCNLDYVHLARKVLMSGINYGAGVLCGPYIVKEETRTWEQDASGRLIAVARDSYRPRFEFVPIWEYYPDMSAKYLKQMEGQFLRKVMSKHHLITLKKREDFLSDKIDEALRLHPDGNYVRRAFETDLKSDGAQVNAQDQFRGKYEAVVWYGYCTGKELKDCGIRVKEDDMARDMMCEVWIVGNCVIKAALNPWSDLDTYGEMNHFHHFIFEEDETFLLGNGLPNIMRDSQMGVCAATRIALDNAAVGRVFEMHRSLMSPNQDITTIVGDKIFYRDDEDPNTMNVPAIRTIDLPSKLNENQQLVNMFQGFADQETFVNAATGGDMQRGPSEPFRTATGASMLRGDAALPFKDVVRNFDAFTESVIGAIINFNRNYNPDPKLRGDFTPVARGATSLIAKEVLGIQLDNLAQTMTEEEKRYMKPLYLLRERVRVRDLPVDSIVMTDMEAKDKDEQDAAQAQAQMQQQMEAMQAQIAEIKSQVMKNLSQAGKNDAAATSDKAGMVMDAMQMGVDINQQERDNELAEQEQETRAAEQAAGAEGRPAGGGTSGGAADGGGGNRPKAAAMPTR